MPLERRVVPPRTYQRTYRASTRPQPHRIQITSLDAQAEANDLQRRLSRGDDRVTYGQTRKRSPYRSCICDCSVSMQADEAFANALLGNEAEETQMLLPWAQAHQSRATWQTEGTSRLTRQLTPTSRANLNELRDAGRASSDSNSSDSNSLASGTLLTSMIPNSVPTTNSANRLSNFAVPSDSLQSLSVSSVSHFDSPGSEVIQYSSVQNSPDSEVKDLHNSDNSNNLSNHDRSSENRAGSPLLGETNSSVEAFRLHARSMSAMPRPSLYAQQVANRVIKHARDNKTPNERCLWCLDCQRLPTLPVTGQCGHTRCTRCIEYHGACPCGVQAPRNLHVNTLIQDLIRTMLPTPINQREVKWKYSGEQVLGGRKTLRIPILAGSPRRNTRGVIGDAGRMVPDFPPTMLMTPQFRFDYARQLLSAGRLLDAAPHLARVAASSEPPAKLARTLLAQALTVVSSGGDPRRLTRELFSAVRSQSATSWLKLTDLECVLCYHSYTSPVSTPCGHTYCRTCIERSMDYRKSCALCLRSLDNFDLAATRDTEFICALLESIDALTSPPPPDPDVIPIFVCTVAYPTIPCPLFIFDPRYWLMIRRVLESGSRKFGMVAYERDRTYSDYGTVLEVCDCVHLEDGRSILSTVGVSRFRVIERDVRDGCDVARIQPLTDISPTEELVIWELRIMATQISYKALLWLNGMNQTVRSEIEAAFGQLPYFDHRQEDWWDSPDGPAWLWWLIAILPLRSEIKILILSTQNLLKRMMAVSRTLEAIDQVSMSAATSSDCELSSALTNAEDWLERSA